MSELGSELRDAGRPTKLGSYLWLNTHFYLGLGAPRTARRSPDCRLRAALGHSPDQVRAAVDHYRSGNGARTINFRCARVIVPGSDCALFVKEFPPLRRFHGLERRLRCSRVDRSWRAGHLLPQLGLPTPRVIGTAQMRSAQTGIVEYLVTEWLEGVVPFPVLLKQTPADGRAPLLEEFARHMCLWHDRGVYLRDLVKNVLVTGTGDARRYLLTDLDGLHPIRWPNRTRLLFHMRQLAQWAKPLSDGEARAICRGYFGGASAGLEHEILESLS